jgi:hypothetical protein
VVAAGHFHVHELESHGADTGLQQLAQIRPRHLHIFQSYKTQSGRAAHFLLLTLDTAETRLDYKHFPRVRKVA